MKTTQAQAKNDGVKNSAKKNGLAVRTSIKAGDFWSDLRAAYGQIPNLAVGSCAATDAAASGK